MHPSCLLPNACTPASGLPLASPPTRRRRRSPHAAHPRPQVRSLANPRGVYERLMGLLARLAGLGLVHCDFNEFNLLVSSFHRQSVNLLGWLTD